MLGVCLASSRYPTCIAGVHSEYLSSTLKERSQGKYSRGTSEVHLAGSFANADSTLSVPCVEYTSTSVCHSLLIMRSRKTAGVVRNAYSVKDILAHYVNMHADQTDLFVVCLNNSRCNAAANQNSITVELFTVA